MKKLYLILAIFTLLILSACQTETSETERPLDAQEDIQDARKYNENTMKIGDIQASIHTDKQVYDHGEPIDAWVETEYTGGKEQIEVTHSASMYFSEVRQLDGNYQQSTAPEDSRHETTLPREEPVRDGVTVNTRMGEPLDPGTYEIIASPTYGKERGEAYISTVLKITETESAIDVTGEIVEIDEERNSILIDGVRGSNYSSNQMNIEVEEETVFHGENVGFADFQTGQRIKSNLKEMCNEPSVPICFAEEIWIE